MLFLLLALLRLTQVPLVMLGRLPGHNKEISPPLFGFVPFFIVGSLIKFTLWTIVFLIHIFGITIFVVRVGVFWDMGVGIHREIWWHTLAWRVQHFFDDHGFSLVWFHSTGHRSNQHPQGNIYWWILWGDLNVVFQYILLQNHQPPMKIWPVAICSSKGWPCICIVVIHVVISSL